MFLALTLCQILSVFLLLIFSLLTNSILALPWLFLSSPLALPWLSLGSGEKWELGDSMVKYGETNMVERGPPRFKLRRSFLFWGHKRPRL